MALRRTGGIEVGKQRSQFFERSSAAFHFQHDVAFVWSRTAIPCLTYGRTRTLGHVVTGYVNGHLFESAKAEANILRRQLENVGVTMVVALYDNWPHPNGHFTSEHLVVFYETVLHMVHQHHDVGLIVKTKKRQLLSRFPSVQAKLMQLIGVGRCILLDGGLSTSIVPSALACDIAVGIPTSTAVCEAALAGCRVLMYDPGCARDHAWVVPNKQGIVHHELEAFSDALSSYLAARDKVTCGDVSNCIADIDPFRDGLAYRRAGDFIVGALKMKDSGKNPREHLEQLPHFESLASTNSARHRETTLTE